MKQDSLRTSIINRIEDMIPIFVLVLMSILPLIEILGRLAWGGGLPGSIVLVQHLTLWIAVAGAMLAARSDRLLALSTQSFLPDRLGRLIKIVTLLWQQGSRLASFWPVWTTSGSSARLEKSSHGESRYG